ncbi:MAG: hypothetical protein SVM86_03130 [Candidatus Cloacimonadota bacterium]|nr:hypothetical protein [Candidatus Cloacimonadota bacterium]
MENEINLQDKLARLIEKFEEIRKNYQEASRERDKYKEEFEQLKNSQEGNTTRVAELEDKQRQAKSELDFLRSENHKLRQKIQEYEEKLQKAASKIDSIFEQINEL